MWVLPQDHETPPHPHRESAGAARRSSELEGDSPVWREQALSPWPGDAYLQLGAPHIMEPP